MKYILYLVILSSFIWSAIGNIGALRGNADIVRNINILKVKSGMELVVEDKVITAEKSRVQAILKDNTIITIGPDSVFVFDSYKFGNKSDSHVDMHIERGFFRSVTGKIGEMAPKRFNIKTVSTTIGIRGTDFSATVSDKQEVVTCHKGQISVMVENKMYIVDEGKQLILSKSSKNKKSSDDDLPSSFSVKVGDSSSSLEDTENLSSTQSTDNKALLNNIAENSNSADALEQIDTSNFADINQRDALSPLENPTVEFPDR